MKVLHSIFHWIWYIIACPFVAFVFFFSMLRLMSFARKYRKNPKKYFLDTRYHFVYKRCKQLFWLKHIKVKTNGTAKLSNSPCLLVYNHKSNVDALVLFKLLYEHKLNANPDFKLTFVAKTELKEKRNVITDVLDLVDAIYIDRKDLRQQFRMFEKQNEMVKDKFTVLIAPEGTRNKNDEFGEYKAGALKLAFHNMIPIQPAVIWGSQGSLFESKVKKVSKTICVTFLSYKKPLDFHSHNIEWISSELRLEMYKEYLRINSKMVENKDPYSDN
ncbi:MAG: 1-acyl-sn-glycerol-3-phosphate acyltransferase [Mycoplasmoidaceae bacterium]|nr:MAG: 1-acyl-sn-glycerol-3-phosphate acyltransferase [Mycoplasmoidaceae bacterium]